MDISRTNLTPMETSISKAPTMSKKTRSLLRMTFLILYSLTMVAWMAYLAAEMAWNERRRAWVGDDKPQRQQRTPRDPIMSWTTTYEDLLLSTEPFQDPIPLAEMVDFLVDTWLEDGLYD